MPPQLFENGKPVQHPLEASFNASAWDILSAIERGFRAQVDVKGKLAELFLYRQLEQLKSSGLLTGIEWRDRDGVLDFLLTGPSFSFEMECKNIRSGAEKFRDAFKVEIQKTRNQLTGGPARGYKASEFQVLAACLFNQTGEWRYLFIRTEDLARRAAPHTDYLQIMQRVPYTAGGAWTDDLSVIVKLFQKRKRP